VGYYRLVAAAISATIVTLVPGVAAPFGATVASASGAGDAAASGAFSAPFEEPNGAYTEATGPTEHCTKPDASGYKACKPTAVNVSVLPDGRILYWNGLSDLENIQKNTVLEAGGLGDSSAARVLDLRSGHPVFSNPTPVNGAGPEPCDQPNACGASQFPLPGNNGPTLDQTGNNHAGDHDMFCSDQVQLADGRTLVAGGTRWYQEPNVAGTPYGPPELQGLRLTQIFDPKTNTFTRVSPMNNGRWYPALVIEGSGNVFVGGGVRKLIQTDGTNVKQTETYDVGANKWTVNSGGDAALPLFPRFHLMPDGSIYYTGAGQMWGPAGQSLDEALYALHQSYDPTYNDPATGHWKVFGVGTFGARSGAFSVLLPLKAPYRQADVLTGGGTLGPPPGGYVANTFSELAHFTTDAGGKMTPSFAVGPMLTQSRWFSSAVTLPNDAVAVFSGANKDEVVDPGNESPVRQAEWYAPWDNQFHALAVAGRDRTYHNTAILLPDASVLVGGHAPIPAHYSYTNNIEHDATAGTPGATANNFRDPSFEIYRPPYLFAGSRPVIDGVQGGIAWGQAFAVHSRSAAQVTSVRLIRLPSLTHIVDANMRSVELPFTRHGEDLVVQAPPSGNVAPPGNYYLFINRGTGAATVPSTAAIVQVGNTVNMRPAVIPFRGAGDDSGNQEHQVAALNAGSGAQSGIPVPAPVPASAAGPTPVPSMVYAAISSRAPLGPRGSTTEALFAVLGGVTAAAYAALQLRRRRRRAS
jgi:hypothetical protein